MAINFRCGTDFELIISRRRTQVFKASRLKGMGLHPNESP